MSLPQFLWHVQLPDVRFRCYKSGDRAKPLEWTALANNVLGKSADARSLAELDKLLGVDGRQIRSLYEIHDGLTLYRDTLSDAAGIELFKIGRWEAQTADMRESFEAMGVAAEEMPAWFSSGVTFGEIPQSANYFLIGSGGDFAGKIFYVDHDDFQEEPLAPDFDTFLGMIAADPPSFLLDRGCYTRYSDGTTDAQWIPAEFVAGPSSRQN